MLEISKFKIGLCQLSVSSDKNINIEKARSSIEFASRKGANLVVLPEMWNCPNSTDFFAGFAENFDDQDSALSFKMLSEVACKEGITIVGGSIPEWSGDHLYNTCCVFAPNGELLAKHRKIHLFDVNIPGDISYFESNTFSAGNQTTLVDTDVGRIGIGICHDIRFPELAMVYRARGAHLICYPGAFNVSTGEALWELEQRSRAVDNQLFMATCSPSRDSAGSYAIWGHSTLVSPLGEIVATSGHEETVVVAEVDYSAILNTRESLPILKQRREDVYQLINLHD
ncbi:Nitrilase/cyanide hydratase and apolipoprotein N-acyltransferase family protein [Perilla frutescens var. frutescens]|nr:Nitrilase/cyanide hydratase and apolipoprotein N-acyltransferase family protein [Perilla frutescens var. frutescens]